MSFNTSSDAEHQRMNSDTSTDAVHRTTNSATRTKTQIAIGTHDVIGPLAAKAKSGYSLDREFYCGDSVIAADME